MSQNDKTISKRILDSLGKVTILLIFIFLPLLFTIIIAAILNISNPVPSMLSKIVPGEMLAFCLSLIAPLFIMFMDTHGKGDPIPAIKPFFLIAFFLYIVTLFTIVLVKNDVIKLTPGDNSAYNIYLITSISLLAISIGIRLFADYHEVRIREKGFKMTTEQEQIDFNAKLQESIDKNG